MAVQPQNRETGGLKRVEEVLNQQGLPASLEAERALLGAFLLNNNLLEEVQENLDPADFALPANQRIYAAVRELRANQGQVDLISLTEALNRKGELEASGGAEYVADLVAGIPRLTSAAHYARIIRERALLRELIQRASQIILDAYSSTDEPAEVLAQAESSILAVGDRALQSTLRSIGSLVPQAVESLETLMQRGEHVTGIPTRFTHLDEMTSGLQRGDLILLAARPSVGKTAFALSLALNAAKNGQTTAFFSLEMSAEQLFFRLLSMESRVDLQALRTGRIPKSKKTEVTLKIEELARLPIYIDDTPVLGVLDMGAKLRRLKVGTPPSLVVVDYLQLLKGDRRYENRNQEVSAISRGLKTLAKELEVPLLALSQLSRAPDRREVKEPILSDLRDSGSLEQDADVVLLLHRSLGSGANDPEVRARARLNIAKQRNGPTGIVELTFLEHQAQFANYFAGLGEGEPGG